MKHRLIIFCLLTCVCATLQADDFPSVMPFRSSTSYWEKRQTPEPPARTGFRAIAAAPFALGEDGITYLPSEMTTGTSSSAQKAKGRSISNPDDDENDPANGCPVGDALFPLLLMIFGYAIYYTKRLRCKAEN